jgi:hypothetical protein
MTVFWRGTRRSLYFWAKTELGSRQLSTRTGNRTLALKIVGMWGDFSPRTSCLGCPESRADRQSRYRATL